MCDICDICDYQVILHKAIYDIYYHMLYPDVCQPHVGIPFPLGFAARPCESLRDHRC